MWIGATEFSLFGKTTLMNLANLAESKGAETLYLVMDRDHAQLKDYKRMFKVIDAERVASADVKELIKSDLVAKLLDVVFYGIDL